MVQRTLVSNMGVSAIAAHLYHRGAGCNQRQTAISHAQGIAMSSAVRGIVLMST
jgi:hypothetical protein